MSPFDFLLYALAAFRLGYLFSEERGPGWLNKRFRAWVSRKAPKKTHLDDGVYCPYCWSIWVSIGLVLSPDSVVVDTIVLVFAVSGAGILFHQLFVWLRRE